MTQSLALGDEAPNFDLTSTEDVLLMLRDEVVRTSLVLYWFQDPTDERARQDLLALARRWDDLLACSARVLAISPAKMPPLKTLQQELKLPFPILTDDRNFARAYGVDAGAEEGFEPALFVVDRRQQVRWSAVPVASVEGALDPVLSELNALPSPTATLPKSIVNRWIDRWVH